MQFLTIYKEAIKEYYKEYIEFTKSIELNLFIKVNNYNIRENINSNDFEGIKLLKEELLDFTSDKFKIYFFTYFFIYSLSKQNRHIENKDIINFIDILKLYSFNFSDDTLLGITNFWVSVEDISNPFNHTVLFKDYLCNIILFNIPHIYFRFIFQYFLIFQFFYENYNTIKLEFEKLNKNDETNIIINYKIFRYFMGYLINLDIIFDIKSFKDYLDYMLDLLIYINNDFCKLNSIIDLPTLLLIKKFTKFYEIKKETYFLNTPLKYDIFKKDEYRDHLFSLCDTILDTEKVIYNGVEVSKINFNDILNSTDYESNFLNKE